MTFDEWEMTVSETLKGDSLWKIKAYRLATCLGDLAWYATTKLAQDQRTLKLSDQLYSAVGSIGANLAEGYSMGTGKNRARFYEYSPGSARESRDWYNKGRHILGDTITEHRMQILVEIIKLLLTMVPDQRQGAIREENTPYEITTTANDNQSWDKSRPLLRDMPLP